MKYLFNDKKYKEKYLHNNLNVKLFVINNGGYASNF